MLQRLLCVLAVLILPTMAQLRPASASSWSGWSYIGQTSFYTPAAVSYYGQLYLFTIGATGYFPKYNTVYYKTFDGSSWSAETPVAGIVNPTGLAAAVLTQNLGGDNWVSTLHLFVVLADNHIYDLTSDGNSWIAPSQVGSLSTTYAPAAASPGMTWMAIDNQIDLFAVDTSQRVEYAVFDGNSWSAWRPIDSATYYAPAATMLGTQTALFGVGTDNAVYSNVSGDGWNWPGWNRIDSATYYAPYAPAAAALSGQIHLLAVGTDNHIYDNLSSDGASWSGWTAIGGPYYTAPAATEYNGKIYAFEQDYLGSIQMATDE